ncbi:hypothetical protein J7E63_27925 [Bacillus sp. ISL-75]|uniref:DmpG-like communication domain-containing protein n=1 Tax=Priestia megaterium TaxID=1404 RepID=A0A6H1PBN9_PRIMG|nr:hypothetical protein [Bacillus sp. ISL-75]MBT2739958.1 hypothetical protein [Bacillus sp. ISL-77]QIZ11034.1 hypothetical protein HFZ78_19600 [Priestia megaterium]
MVRLGKRKFVGGQEDMIWVWLQKLQKPRASQQKNNSGN